MMKKTVAIISTCMLTFTLSACSGSDYVMYTDDGHTIVSDNKPQTDSGTGMIPYKDVNDSEQQISRIDVREMVELDQQFAIARQKKAPQLSGTTLITTDKQSKCIGGEKRQLCCHGLSHKPIANTTTQHHSRKPKVHQSAHSGKTFRSGSGSATAIGICWQKLSGQSIMARIKKTSRLHNVV